MKKRAYIVACVIFTFNLFLVLKIFITINDEYIVTTSDSQSSYELCVEKFRGSIYDCNGNNLVYDTESENILAVIPSGESVALLKKILPENEFNQAFEALSQATRPVLIKTCAGYTENRDNNIIGFNVPKRYSNQNLCSHIIGYCDTALNGMSGIEKSLNDYLNIDAKIAVKYTLNANGNLLSGYDVSVTDTEDKKAQGVALTIDKNIQEIVKEVSEKYMKMGAVVVTQVPNCEIRAILSRPDFDPQNISESLNRDSSPLLNRSLSAYSLGSVFKIITSAYAIENGLDTLTPYDCNGSISLDSQTHFDCFNRKTHGVVDLENAFAYSCNGYFINLTQDINTDDFLDFTKNFGLGKNIELAPEFCSVSGTLPDKDSLYLPNAMANFSFGQGKLTATPLQVNAVVNMIASNGKYILPSLIKSLVNESGEEYEVFEPYASKSIIEESTAKTIQKYMSSTIEYGTALNAKSDIVSICAKTGTAQTGQYDENKEIEHCWLTGFFPKDNPKYVLTVFSENAKSVTDDCVPIFKEIAEKITLLENG